MAETSLPQKKFLFPIIILSIIIPVLIGILFFTPKITIDANLDFLPMVNATINGTCSLVLIVAVWAIKNGKQLLHRQLMIAAMVLSGLFLVTYVLYHATHDSTKFGGTGTIKYIYYFILLSHILLSIIILPLVLTTFGRALNGNFPKHKKLARITFPLWLYVTVTGVLVYLMIAPYY